MKGIVLCLLITFALASAELRLSRVPRSWQDAAKDCASVEGDSLPNILNDEQQKRLITRMKEANLNLTWTGLNRLHDTQKTPWDWRYHTLSLTLDPQVRYFPDDEPNNIFGDEFCVAARRVRAGRPVKGIHIWNDAQCFNKYYYFCDINQK